MLGEQHAARDLADLVAGAADPLQGARDRGRRLDLHDEVDRAHVDAELEAAGRDHARQPAALEVVLDDGALLLGHRAVVGAGDERCARPSDWPDWAIISAGVRLPLVALVETSVPSCEPGSLGRQLVEPGRQPLGQPAGVGEHDRRAVLLDQVEHPLLDVGPQRAARGPSSPLLAELGHVLDRHDDLEVPLLLRRRSHDLDRGRAAEEAGDLVDRPHGRREPDALGGLVEQLVEALEGDGQVGAALGAGDRVHLVDDHGLDAAQRLAGLRGEHQEQRLGRRDQDVGRGGLEPRRSCGVVSPERTPTRISGTSQTEPVGGLPDADQRCAEVALDVDGERLERRDVEDPAALLLLRHRLGGQPVDRPEERGERLAGPGRRHHQGMPACRDRVPRAALRRRRRREGSGEPLLRRRAELVHPAILPDGTDSFRGVDSSRAFTAPGRTTSPSATRLRAFSTNQPNRTAPVWSSSGCHCTPSGGPVSDVAPLDGLDDAVVRAGRDAPAGSEPVDRLVVQRVHLRSPAEQPTHTRSRPAC